MEQFVFVCMSANIFVVVLIYYVYKYEDRAAFVRDCMVSTVL